MSDGAGGGSSHLPGSLSCMLLVGICVDLELLDDRQCVSMNTISWSVYFVVWMEIFRSFCRLCL